MVKKITLTVFAALIGFALNAYAAESGAKKPTPKNTGPALSKEQKAKQMNELRTEAFVANTERQAVEQLHKLLKKYKGNKNVIPALLFRLGEMRMSQSKSARVFEMYKEDVNDDKEAMSFLPKFVTSHREKEFILKAIKVYEKIEKEHPNFDKMDLVLFNNGFAHLQANMKNGAEISFMRFIKNPKLKDSEVMPDVLLALGEISFEKNIFGKALAFYELLEKYKDSKVYPYAVYKSAWCKYNLQDPSGALKLMEKVVSIGHKVETLGLDSKLDLRREALNGMTLFFSESRVAKDAHSYFKKQAGNIDPSLYLEKLAKIYNGHGKLKEEELVLKGLVSNYATNPRLPFYHKKLSVNYDGQNDLKKSVKHMTAFDQTCDKVINRYKSNPELELKDPQVGECQDLVDSYSLKTAKTWLKEGEKQKKQKKRYEVAAEEALRINLKGQKPTEKNSAARYIFADLLFKSDKFKNASVQYEFVGETSKKEDVSHDARYASIVSHDKAVANKWDDRAENRLKKLVANYLKKHPEGKYYLDVSFKVGLLDYKKEKFDLAKPRFYSLGKKFPDKDKGKKAQDLYLDILNASKDYIALQKGALEWKSLESDPKRQKDLQKIFEQAYFSHTQVMVSEEKYKDAIKLYRQFALSYPKSDLADEAQWNVIDLYHKQNDNPGAAAAYVDFHDKFPDHEKAIEGLIRAADLYEQMSMPARALNVTRVLATKDRKNKESWLLLSGDFLAASGKYYDAINEYRKIYGSAKTMTDQVQQSIDRVIYLADQLGTQSEYLGFIRDMAKSSVPNVYSPAVATYAEGLKKIGDSYNLGPWLKSALNRKLLPEDLAKVNLLMGEIKESNYLAFDIQDHSMQAITSGLEKKTQMLSDVQASYQGATEGGDAYTTVNALVGLASLYQGFVASVNEIEGPSSFSNEDRQALKNELSNVVFPFEEKAVETVDAALKLAKKSDLRDGSVGKVQKILDKLNMKEREISSINEFLPGPAFTKAPRLKGVR